MVYLAARFWCLLFNFALEYAIRRIQVNQDDLKLNGTHHLLAWILTMLIY